jgi:hypothetical protein
VKDGVGSQSKNDGEQTCRVFTHSTVQTPIPTPIITVPTATATVLPVPMTLNKFTAPLSAAPALATVIGVWPGSSEFALATPPNNALPSAQIWRMLVTIEERFAPFAGWRNTVWFVCSKQSTHCG